MRGYRIELAEIEAALRAHPDVETAVAFVIDNTVSGPQIAGWAATGTAQLGAGDLRQFLERQLPPYMIPGQLVSSERLRVTANGKVDEAAFLTLASRTRARGADGLLTTLRKSCSRAGRAYSASRGLV